MKIHLIITTILLSLFTLNDACANEENRKAASFLAHYIPSGMDKEFKIPLDDYLFLLAKSSNHTYLPPDPDSDCLSFLIPLPRGYDKKTIMDNLNHISLSDFHNKFKIEIWEKDTLIKLVCSTPEKATALSAQ